jgi:S1-C subfamily serine protease
MNKKGIFMKFTFIFTLFFIFNSYNLFPKENVILNELSKGIVNIKVSKPKSFDSEATGIIEATGFIIDKKLGLIVTNRHVCGPSPSDITVGLLNGETISAYTVYFDPFHDFSIIRVDPEKLPEYSRALKLGNTANHKIGDKVILIGNNDSEEYSIKKGIIVSTERMFPPDNTQYFQTSFDSAGGSSGSPIINERQEVIGLHSSGKDQTSFEIPIQYINYIYRGIKNGKLKRGHIGVFFDYVKTATAITYLGFPKILGKNLINRGTKNLITFKNAISNTVASTEFLPGDIFTHINNVEIGQNTYKIFEIMNENVGKNIDVKVIRSGKTLSFKIPVMTWKGYEIDGFVEFNNSILHEITTNAKIDFETVKKGVFLSFAPKGSPFYQIGHERQENQTEIKSVIITHINGTEVNSLSDLYKKLKKIKPNDPITVNFKDWLYPSVKRIKFISAGNFVNLRKYKRYDQEQNIIWKQE